MSTISSRSKERAAAFAAATPAQQKTIQEGWIDSGFTPDMVYIALGKPDSVDKKSDGTEVWIYRNYSAAAGSASLGKAKAKVSSISGSTGMVAGQPTSRGGGIKADAAPDMNSMDAAEDMTNLYVSFYNGVTNNVRVKRG